MHEQTRSAGNATKYWMGPCLAEGDRLPRARRRGCATSTTSKAGAAGGGGGSGATCGALWLSVGGIAGPGRRRRRRRARAAEAKKRRAYRAPWEGARGRASALRRAWGQGNATKRCDFYWVGPRLAEGDRARLERMQAQRLHEAGAAGAGAQCSHRRERVAHYDAQVELIAVDNAAHPGPRRAGAGPGRRRGRAGRRRGRDRGRPARSGRRWPRPRLRTSSAGVASGAMPT